MAKQQEPQEKPITVRDLYPELNDEELAEAERTWNEYIAFVIRVYERRQGTQPVEDRTHPARTAVGAPSRSGIREYRDILEKRRTRFDGVS